MQMPPAILPMPDPESNSALPPKVAPPPIKQDEARRVESQASPEGRRTIRKCVQDGKVTFTDNPCPDGATHASVTVNTANVGTVAPKVTQAPVQQIPQPIAPIQVPTSQASSSPSIKQMECPILDMEIKQIDSLSRQPLSGQAQDNLNMRRNQVRSRQFDLRC